MAEGFQIGSAFIDVHADVDGVQREVSSKLGGGSGGGFFKGVGIAAGGFLAAGVVTAAGAGIKKLVGTGFGEYLDADALNKQLAAGLASTGNAAGVTVDHMNDLAASIQGYSGQTDDSIAQTESLLLTFTNISNNNPQKIFDKTTVAAADMAATMGGDASKYAIQLGKALNDPTAGVSKLTKVGVTFTEQQKSQIAAMQKSGDVAGAQAVILQELNKEFGGRAAAAGQSFSGTLQRIQRGFEDVTQSIVSSFMPLILPALNAVANGLEKIAPIAGEVSTKIVDFVKSIDFKSVGSMFSGLSGSFGGLVGPLTTVVTSMSPLSILLKALGPVIPQIAGALGQLGAALGGALATILPTVVQLISTLVGVLSGVLAQILPIIANLLLTVVQAITPLLPVVGQLAQVLGAALGQALTALAPLLVQIVTAAASLITALLPIIPAVVGILSAVLPLVPALVQLAVTALQPLISILVAVLPAVTAVVNVLVAILVPAINIVIGVVKLIVGAITGFIGFLTGSAAPDMSGFASTFNGIWQGIQTFVGNVVKGIQTVVMNIFNAVGSFIGGIVNTYAALIQAGWKLAVGYVTAAVGVVKTVIQTAFDVIKGYIQTVTSIWGSIIEAAWNTIKSVVGAGVGVVKTVIQTAMDLIKAIFTGNWNAIPGIISGAAGKIGGIVSDLVGNVVGIIKGLGGKVSGAVSNFGSLLLGAGKNLVEGLINGIKGMIGSAISTVTDLAGSVVKAAQGALGIHSPSTVFAEIGDFVGKGFIKGLLGTKNAIDSNVAQTMGGLSDKVVKYFDDLPGKLTKSQAAIKGTILGVVGDVTKSLDGEADKRTKYLKTLDDEVNKLNAVKDARTNYKQSVIDSSIALGSVTSVKATDDNPVTAAGIIANLATAKQSVTQFKGIYDQLKSLGLDQATLGQITAGFQQNGDLTYAQAILAGGKDAVNQINSLQGSLSTAANALGSDTAATMFDAGVNVAQGLVNGVKSQISAVEDAMESMAKSITKKVKKALKIKSPSRVMANEVGQYIPLGVVKGIQSQQGTLDKAMTNMVRTPGTSAVSASRVPSVGARTGSIATSNDVYIESVVLDASSIEDMQTVISIFSGLGQTARQGRGQVKFS